MYNCAPSCAVHLTASPILESLAGFCNTEYIANYQPAKYFLHSTCVLLSISCLVNYVRLCTCALCTSWALSRNLTHQLLHLPPSDPLDQDTVTIASASCNSVQLLCFCSVFFGAQFCWVHVYLQYYWCLSSRISAFNLRHFHGFQVIANWRLAQIARALGLLQKSKH